MKKVVVLAAFAACTSVIGLSFAQANGAADARNPVVRAAASSSVKPQPDLVIAMLKYYFSLRPPPSPTAHRSVVDLRAAESDRLFDQASAAK